MKNRLDINSLLTHGELCQALGLKVRRLREHLKLSRDEVSKLSRVSVPTIGRLETKGIATIGILMKIARALGAIESLDGVFNIPKYRSIDEFIKNEQ